jgi:HTH-type transcriptional regulator/antitoxin HigA
MNTELKKIKDEQEYELIMAEILDLMNKGEDNLSSDELEKIRTMALAAQAYEKEHYYIHQSPSTFQDMVELVVYEMKLKQKDVAGTLCIRNAKLSLNQNGDQRPHIPFIKAVYHELNVPAISS